MTKILITGFRHSGTTMLMKLLRAHPQVGWIEDEESYIEFDKDRDWILMLAKKKVPNLKKFAWGEKIPWAVRPNDMEAERAIKFSKKWLKYFKDGRVLHILRHPADVLLSGAGVIGDIEKKYWMSSVPKMIEFCNSNKRCSTIVYEGLLTNPEIHLLHIFKFLGLDTNQKIIKKVRNTKLKFGKINLDRAFAFKKKDIKFKFDYEKLLDTIERVL
jgi:hypothetical protein